MHDSSFAERAKPHKQNVQGFRLHIPRGKKSERARVKHVELQWDKGTRRKKVNGSTKHVGLLEEQ